MLPLRPLAPPLVADAGFYGNGLVELTGIIDTDFPPEGGPFDVWPQTSGPPVLVLHAATVHLGLGTSVRVRGSRALAILARDSISIEGVLDASAHLAEPGPGGFSPGSGLGAGAAGQADLQIHMTSGGGGAGHATIGATGGVGGGSNQVPGGRAGLRTFEQTVLRLAGGSGGGEGGVDSCAPAAGGAGGGALLLFSSGRISIGAMGRVLAGGGGGQGGRSCVWHGGGGGGGAGGTVLVSAPQLELQGTVVANGGAGGAGAGVTGSNGGDGEDGRASTSPARGGQPVAGAGATAGGAGGSLDAPPATPPMSNLDDGGGGGGAVGQLRLTTSSLQRSTATLSPEPLVVPWAE